MHAWHARAVGGDVLESDSLVGLAGRLYAVTQQAEAAVGTSRLVRLDPHTGKVLARSAQTIAWQLRPVLASGLVWTFAADTTTVLGFDPVTLAVSSRVRVSLPGNAEQGVSIAAGGRISAVVAGGGRTVAFVDPGGVRRRLSVDGLVSGVALNPDATRLYVITLTPDHFAARLETLDPRTGRRLAAATSSGPVLGALATSGGVWDTWAGGHAAGIEFRRASELASAIRPSAGASGGGEDVLPAISSGVAWLGGDGVIGCADPETGGLRATTRLGTGPGDSVLGYLSGMTAAGQSVFAIFHGSVGGRDETILIEMTPPAECFAGCCWSPRSTRATVAAPTSWVRRPAGRRTTAGSRAAPRPNTSGSRGYWRHTRCWPSRWPPGGSPSPTPGRSPGWPSWAMSGWSPIW
jgi:hypothetical protein